MHDEFAEKNLFDNVFLKNFEFNFNVSFLFNEKDPLEYHQECLQQNFGREFETKNNKFSGIKNGKFQHFDLF